ALLNKGERYRAESLCKILADYLSCNKNGEYYMHFFAINCTINLANFQKPPQPTVMQRKMKLS
ncbi:MAG: hypothetical protein MJE68_14315, partial [Proteobacteria bacterium]|nr:hypothetical protein [Pseudomonadota bacterium]